MNEKQKILIVDDLRENLFALRQILGGLDAEIIEATSGNEALAATLDHNFAVAILDIMMPGMSGYELAEYLRGDEKTKVIPIIFLTASYPDEQNQFKGYEVGGIDFIVKPYAPEVLLGKVNIFLELDRHRRELQQHRDHLETLVAEGTAKLAKRIKEVKCLYTISSLVAEPYESIDESLRIAVDLIPPGWQHPEITRARIIFNGKEFAAADFKETAWKQSANIVLEKETVGTVEVCYMEESSTCDEGPFLKEERHLLTDIARQLGIMIARNRAKEDLHETNNYLENLINYANAPIVVWDQQLKITRFNHAVESLTGIKASDVIGKPVESLFPTPMAPSTMEFIKETERGRRWNAKEIDIKHVDGSLKKVLWNSANILAADGKTLIATIVHGQDITEYRSLEEQIRQSQKLEAIGLLAGGVAHDFNNLLMVMMGHCELMQEQIGAEDKLAAHISEIRVCTERAAALTRQLLAFSRKQALQPRILNLNEVVVDLEKMLRRLIGEDIDFVTSLADDLDHVKADPGQIEQVIMNLAVNARDAMPQGGRLTIETVNVNIDETYSMNHLSSVPGPHVMLSVTDSGCGMDKETREHIFDPFFTTKGREKGTGLGLSTVYGIVKQSNGNIWVYSEPGKGTIFKIYLPSTDDRPAAELERAELKEHRAGSEHVLLVEDETSIRNLFTMMLEGMGYSVTVTANGEEALLAVEKEGVHPDLLITDIVMPGMSGVELAERLRERQPDMKVLFMSGYTGDTILHHGIPDSEMHFIQKPFSKSDFAAKIEEVLMG